MSGQVVSARKGCTIITATTTTTTRAATSRSHGPPPAHTVRAQQPRGRVSPGSAGDGAGVREAERGEGDEKLVPSAIATAASPFRSGRRRRH